MLNGVYAIKNEGHEQDLEHNVFEDILWSEAPSDTGPFFDPAKPDRVTVGTADQAGVFVIEGGWQSGIDCLVGLVIYGWLMRLRGATEHVLGYNMVNYTQVMDNLLHFNTVFDLLQGDSILIRVLTGHGQPVHTATTYYGTFLKMTRMSALPGGLVTREPQPEPKMIVPANSPNPITKTLPPDWGKKKSKPRKSSPKKKESK